MSTSLGADALDLVRRRVINVVGHELRTPVTTVRGLAELLEHATEAEARETIIPALIRNARRSEELLDDLLIASDVSTAAPVDDPVAIDLDALAADVVSSTSVRVDSTAPALAHGHPATVRRALRHLVSNADKYHDAEPTLTFEDDADGVTIVVVTPVDRPVGDIELSFEVFFRGESAVTRSAGIGIGLPAARALARIDGGDVDVVHEDGAVVARLRLPKERA